MTNPEGNLNVSLTPKDKLDYEVQAWKLAIEVQEHFNTLEMQIRNFAITVLGGVIGAAALVHKDSPLSSKMILIAGLVIWLAFFTMDRLWYHQLLTGSVKHAQRIEDRLKGTIPGISLSQAIGDASPFIIGKMEIHTNGKMLIFYGLVALVLVVLILVF